MSDLIERSEVLKQLWLNHKDVVYIDKKECARRIEEAPSIDIVRCGECIRRKKNKFCLELNRYAKDDNGHCSWGVKERDHE